jgi:hypothetical protein
MSVIRACALSLLFKGFIFLAEEKHERIVTATALVRMYSNAVAKQKSSEKSITHVEIYQSSLLLKLG